MRCIILFSIILIVSCKSRNKHSGRFENISSSDTTCLKAIAKAKTDLTKGRLIYYHHAGSLLYNPLRSEHEMDSLLKPYNIRLTNYNTSDVIISGQTQGCYEDYMNEYLANRFGQGFIDSLLFI